MGLGKAARDAVSSWARSAAAGRAGGSACRGAARKRNHGERDLRAKARGAVSRGQLTRDLGSGRVGSFRGSEHAWTERAAREQALCRLAAGVERGRVLSAKFF